MGDIKKMLDPRTVAFVGATDREGSVGRATLENLLLSKDRQVFAINPGRTEALGLSCHASVGDIQEHIDLAVIATPAATVPGILDDCARAGTEGAIIISSGFSETGKEGKELEGQLLEIAGRYGIRIVGPNCPGIIIPNNGLYATFLQAHPAPGIVAFISQSGTLGDAILRWGVTSHVGFSFFAALGSMIDVGFADLIDYLQEDYFTRSIMLYMERVTKTRRFMSAARGFARSRPIVVLKPGRFPGSTRAVLAHNGVEPGDDAVYDAAFRRAGLVRAKEVEDLFDTAKVLASKPLPKGPRLVIVTNSGAAGIIANDILMELGGQLAQLSRDTRQALESLLQVPAAQSNPVDIGGDADKDRYIKTVEACLKDQGADGFLLLCAGQTGGGPNDLAVAIGEVTKKTAKPVIVTLMGGGQTQEGKDWLELHNIPVYETPEEAVKAYLHMYHYQRNLELLNETPEELPLGEVRLHHYLKAVLQNAMKGETGRLGMEEALGFLTNYRIPVAKTAFARSADEAARVAERIGYPVVLTAVLSKENQKESLARTADSGADVKDAYHAVEKILKDHARVAPVVMVQEALVLPRHQWAIRSLKDRDFGSIVGFGRVREDQALATHDALAVPPLNQTLAKRLLEEAGIAQAAEGDGGEYSETIVRHLEEFLVRFSNFVVDFPEIREAVLSPLILSGDRVCCLDASITVDKTFIPGDFPYPHLVIVPYPTRYITTWTLDDGTEVILRPIRPEDEPAMGEMLSGISEETLRVRFFVVMEINHKVLTQFCNIDYDREIAFVAEAKTEGKNRIIGGGQLIIEPDYRIGQFAVLVHDDYHGRGLGEKLVDMAIGIAQERGLDEVYGIVLTENEKMLRVSRKLGFKPTILPDGITRVTLKLK
jgi:acetyltransferase